MSEAEVVSPLRLIRQRSFVFFWCARTMSNAAFMMQGVAIGWQIYALTNDPMDLGLVGLVQFFPVVLLSLVIGQAADRFDRRAIAAGSQVAKAIAALALALGTASGWLTRESMLALLLLSGTARAFELPTMHALIPALVPGGLLPRAIAASTSAQQTAVICGPSLGGLLYGWGPTAVYATCTVVFIAASLLISRVHIAPAGSERKPISMATMLAGLSYIFSRPILLGAISLDLFAVLLGGVTAPAADLRARHLADRSMGARAPAFGAGRRRTCGFRRACSSCDQWQCGTHHVCRGGHVWRGKPLVCTLDLDCTVRAGARNLRRLGCNQRRHSAVAGSAAHAVSHAGTGFGGKFDVYRLVGFSRRVSGGRRRRLARSRCLSRDRGIRCGDGDACLAIRLSAAALRSTSSCPRR